MSQLEIDALYTVNEVQISYRNKTPYPDRIQIVHSATAYEILRQTWDENRIELLEQFKILLLDRRNNCLGVSDIASGGTSTCPVDPKIVFVTALKANAASIILAHNHPSGSPNPSECDIALTRKLMQGGKLLDINVLDHLIITPRHYYSLADEGIMPR